jgi:hypothetical protein
MSPISASDLRRARRVRALAAAISAVGLVAVSLIVWARYRKETPEDPRARVQPPTHRERPRVPAEPPKHVQPPEPKLADLDAPTLEAQRQGMLENMRRALGITASQLAALEAIIERSDWMSQGNPKVTEHPMTRGECHRIRARLERRDRPEICGAPFMVPLHLRGERPEQARACIDQFEFPNVPCEYPVIWVKADEAVALCEAMGKRICDAHEWEGACAGELRHVEDEYAFGERRLQMEYLHNEDREMIWAYGKDKDHTRCATGSRKSPGCVLPTWEKCGSNTYPAGAFPDCVSAFGVYDLHGNAAEHMNLPLSREQLASVGGYGQTEMKGSWFIFTSWEAHPDDCRWRARNWHGSKIKARGSHRNYHLGFRCCKNVKNVESGASKAP